MKTTLYPLFLALSIFILCANGVLVTIQPPQGSTVRVRSGPSTSSLTITTLHYGKYDSNCFIVGEVVASPTGASNDRWYHLTAYNGYVAGVYVHPPPGAHIPVCTRGPPNHTPDVPAVGSASAKP